MKKNHIALLAGTALYSFMFYEQGAGINFLIFTIAVIILLLMRDKTVTKRKEWLAACAGSLLSALCVAWYGNALSVTANIISLSLLSTFSYGRSSVPFALLYSLYSYSSSLLFMFITRLEQQQEQKEEKSSSTFKKILLVAIPFLIVVIFFFMYRGSNPLFNEFAKNINLDFISMNWITFTLAGFVLLFGFFHHQQISFLSLYDGKVGNRLEPSIKSTFSLFGKKLDIGDENFSGITLFLMLNALLLIVNALDFNFLFIDGKLPAGLSYSEFVHQGIGMLITSIVVAIAIILFYFRGALNFYEKNPLIKFLAFLWIIQNICMLFSTTMRNSMYINEYGLTYKRVGVYAYLFLTAIGLCTTLLKISQRRTNMYLFRINSWLFFWVLVFSCFVGWDELITDFNINRSKQLEKRYLLYLSYSNLPQLFALQADSLHKHKEFKLETKEYDSQEESDAAISSERDFATELNRKLFFFQQDLENTDFRSWTYINQMVSRKLHEKQVYNTIYDLQLASCHIKDITTLTQFRYLKKLNLSNNGLTNVKVLQELADLEELDLSSNPILDFSPLYKLSKLKSLRVPTYNAVELAKLHKYLPNTQIIQ